MKTTLISSQEKYPFLRELGIQDLNRGACAGPDDWGGTQGRELLQVVTPIDGSVIAKVAFASESDYEHIVKTAQESFLKSRIADFAVGLSRQLYELTMQSERPMHKMYDQ